MIVRQFLQWVRQAPPGERAEATSALARAYLYSDLSSDDLAAAEGAMIMLLDDPSPLVRRALSEVFASCEQAPQVVVHALAADQPDVALPVLEFSPLLREDDLVDLIATGRAEAQIAVAKRCLLTRGAAAAMAEVGEADACLALLENVDADIPRFSIDRIIERFGHLAPIRENLLARGDLSTPMRQALISKLSQALAGFVTARQWLESEHAEFAAREACEKATVALAADTSYDEVAALVRHLRQSGQLTAGMLLRALLSGNVVQFEEALAELSGISIDRVTAYIHDKTFQDFARFTARRACLTRRIRPFGKRSRQCAPASWSASRAGRPGSSGAWSSACSALAPMNAGRTVQRSSPCCGALPWKRRARTQSFRPHQVIAE